jgi:hypothetical protein
MNITTPQSWYDLPLMSPMDPRSVVSFVNLQDSGGGNHSGIFQNSSTFLNNTTWHTPPIAYTSIATVAPMCNALTPQDSDAVVTAANWTAAHGILASNTQLPPTILRSCFLKAGNRFQTTINLDWTPGVTSTDVQLSFKDNSGVGGNLITGSSTVPVLAWSGNTFGGLARALTISTIGPGRVAMVLRIIDNSGNWSMFEMDWNIVN